MLHQGSRYITGVISRFHCNLYNKIVVIFKRKIIIVLSLTGLYRGEQEVITGNVINED